MDDITAMDMDATNIVTAMLSGSVDAWRYMGTELSESSGRTW